MIRRLDELPDPVLDFEPPRSDCLKQPLFVDARGRKVPDPYQRLQVEYRPGGVDPEEVRQAYKRQLLAHPPERDPLAAVELREARDRLLDPERVLERELGILHVPDAEAWELPDWRGLPDDPNVLSSDDRLMGQLVLYALLEEVLLEEPPRTQRGLFDD